MSKDNGGPDSDKIQQARRELFVAWYRVEFPALELRVQNLIGTYTKYHADLSWQAFNAALDAVVIELPTPAKAMAAVMDYQDNKRQNVTGTTNWAANLGMCVVNDCRAAIESTNLGIKVK